MFRVVTKLKMVKKALILWRNQKPIPTERIDAARTQLDHVQSQMMNNPNDANLFLLEKKLREKLEKEILIEESMQKQKSREKHLNVGRLKLRVFLLTVQIKHEKIIVSILLQMLKGRRLLCRLKLKMQSLLIWRILWPLLMQGPVKFQIYPA